MAVAEDVVKGTLVVDFMTWSMMASWLASVVDELKKDSCLDEDTADLERRNLLHGVSLAIEAYKNTDVDRMNMARDIIVGVMDKVVSTLDNCGKRGDKA